jgi:hypothetical protein
MTLSAITSSGFGFVKNLFVHIDELNNLGAKEAEWN